MVMREDLKALLEALQSGAPAERGSAAKQLARMGAEAEPSVVALVKNASDPWEVRLYLSTLANFHGLFYAASVDAIVQRLSNENVRIDAAYCLLKTSPKLRRRVPTIRAILHRESY